MTVVLIVFACALGLHLPLRLPVPGLRTRRDRSAVVAGVCFVGAGALHFFSPAAYLPMMPPVLPYPLALIYVSGVAEMLGGAGLLVPALRPWAALGLAGLLVAVFPANVYVAWADVTIPAFADAPRWAYWARLPFQGVLIAWVLWAGGVWPRRAVA